MATVIQAGFDTANFDNYVQVSANDGLGIITATITGTLFPSISGTIDGRNWASAIHDIVTKLNSLGGSWTGGYILNQNKFYLSSSSGWRLTFSELAKKVFGFQDTAGFVQYTTSSTDPFFIWVSAENGISQDTNEFERDVPYREDVTDDGRTFALSVRGNFYASYLGVNNQEGFLFRDWMWMNEPVYKVFSQYSSSQSPYTWQEHVKHCRSYTPWVFFESNTGSVVTYNDRKGTYKFRGEEAVFKPEPMFQNQSAFWNIRARTRQLSRGTNFGTENFLLDGFS